MKKVAGFSVVLATLLMGAHTASAAPVIYSNMSMLSNPNNANAISQILAPQNTLLQAQDSAKQAAAAAAATASASTSLDSTANLITQEVESNIATTISQTITNTNGNAPLAGSFSLGNGQTINYNRASGQTSVTITKLGQSPINLSFPTIQ